jgi:hypothetical protein
MHQGVLLAALNSAPVTHPAKMAFFGQILDNDGIWCNRKAAARSQRTVKLLATQGLPEKFKSN